MKNSEDIKLNIAGKFTNNLYKDIKELMYDLDVLCKQVVKEQLSKDNAKNKQMKTLYFTVEKELQDIDGIEETTGYKTITVYDIVDNKPKLVVEIEAENEYSTKDELEYFAENLLQEEDFETHLDKELTYIFEQL